MKDLIMVHGMKRTANHAVIDWILAQDQFIFSNNIIPVAPILRGEATLPEPVDFTLWLKREHSPQKRFLRTLADPFLNRNRRIMVSLEDLELGIQPFQNIPCPVTHVLILRNPQNLFASRIRKASRIDHPSYPRQTGEALDGYIRLWKSQAREFLGETSQLPDRVGVYFDRWFVDEEYRKAISRRLDVEFTDAGFSGVSQVGGGSSFDGTRFDGQSGAMDVLNRRDQLDPDEQRLLETVLADDELMELEARIEAYLDESPDRT